MGPTDLAFGYGMNPTPFVLAYVAFIYGLKKYVEPGAPFLNRPRKVNKCLHNKLYSSSIVISFFL